MWKEYKVPIVLGACSIICITIALIILFSSARPAKPIEFSQATVSASAAVTGEILVDIAGAVVRPGVYALPFGSRFEDAIDAAGGIRIDADKEAIAKTINRAAKLSDGAKLYIPLLTDEPVGGVDARGSVSVNAASQSELETLSGVGPATAQKIIAGRPYTSLEELVAKKVLSQSLFEKLRAQLTL